VSASGSGHLHGFALNVTTDLPFPAHPPVRLKAGSDVDRGDGSAPRWRRSRGGAAACERHLQGSREPGPRAAPDWLKVRAPRGNGWRVSGRSPVRPAHRMPEAGVERGSAGRGATVILLGNVCTRGCAFCGVTAGCPLARPAEPSRVANAATVLSAARGLNLRHPRHLPTAERRTSHPSCAPCEEARDHGRTARSGLRGKRRCAACVVQRRPTSSPTTWRPSAPLPRSGRVRYDRSVICSAAPRDASSQSLNPGSCRVRRVRGGSDRRLP